MSTLSPSALWLKFEGGKVVSSADVVPLLWDLDCINNSFSASLRLFHLMYKLKSVFQMLISATKLFYFLNM